MKKLIALLFVIITSLPLLSCGGGSDDDGQPQQPPVEKPEEGEKPKPDDNKIPPTIADSSYTYYNRTFLYESGSLKYYRDKIGSKNHAYFWNQALIILMVQDRYDFRKDETLKPLIKDLLNTFLNNEKNPATNNTMDWTWNRFNDDLLWAGLAFIRGYQITGEKRFLEQAEYDWDLLYTRGYDKTLGGGIWWSTHKTGEEASKSALSNDPAISMACYLYEATKKKSYLEQAKDLYNWVCVGYNGKSLFNSLTGSVDEKMNPDGSLSNSYNVYTSGAFIEAAAALYRITKDQFYYDDAVKAIDFVIKNKTNADGIVSKWHLDGTWQSEFARGMGMFVKDNNLWDKYYDWMHKNAVAAWKTRSKTYNITGNEWAKPSPERDWTALECVSAVCMTQAVPDKKP